MQGILIASVLAGIVYTYIVPQVLAFLQPQLPSGLAGSQPFRVVLTGLIFMLALGATSALLANVKGRTA